MAQAKLKAPSYLIMAPQLNNDLWLVWLGQAAVIKQRVYKQGASCEKMAGSISNFLTNQGVAVKPPTLKGVAVCQGEGSFSRQRLTVTVANALAYAFKIPALAVKPAGWKGAKAIPSFAALDRQFKKLSRDNLAKVTYN